MRAAAAVRRDRRSARAAIVRLGTRLAAVAVLAPALVVLTSPLAPSDARAAPPRVAIIVGPVGSLTASYRADAERAAAEARRFTDDVVTVSSPDATWDAAKAALRGASVVVYLGHGNGWPSRYSSTLNPRTQDGLGLNPVAGVDDVAHQYFGESYLAQGVELAPNAVVILSHLCYASGNSEPGLPEGPLDVARQRVDNFAAGWLAAGAGAVLADAYQGPATYVRAILAGKGTVEGIWRTAPSAHDHVIAFPSVRTPGFTALMDPTRATRGFYRSLVTRADLRADEVAAGAAERVAASAGGAGDGTGMPPGGWEVVLPPSPPVTPNAFDLGALPGTPALIGMPLAAASLQLVVPVELPDGVSLATAYELGTRWIALDEAGAPTGPDGGPDQATGPDAAAAPGVGPGPGPGVQPAGADRAGADGPTGVARESAASLVDLVPATVAAGAISGSVTLPASSGRYRLEVTLHDQDGIALSYAVQASIPSVDVHVGGPGAAWLDLPPSVTLTAGTRASLQVVVTNGEPLAWGGCHPTSRGDIPGDAGCAAVSLVGRWVALAGDGTAAPMTRGLAIPAAASQTTWLSGPVPSEVGTYLVVASLERTTADGAPQVLGRPTTVTVRVVRAPLLPTPWDAPEPGLPPPGGVDPASVPIDGGLPAGSLLPAQPTRNPELDTSGPQGAPQGGGQ